MSTRIHPSLRTSTLALALLVGMSSFSALPARAEQTIYGSQLMTAKERTEYRAKLRAAKTEEERQKIRAEHHEAMQKRAQERGVKLPDAPPAAGMHQGRPGGGMGPGGGGMGPGAGGGMGPGGGRP